jgi:oligopeptide/dipeptide ABC transporter ATP-binding protein
LLLKPTEGSIKFEGKDLLVIDQKELRKTRAKMSMIFQDPYSSLNPRKTVSDIVGQPLEIHRLAEGKEKEERVAELLQKVGLRQDHIFRFPHEFSGGQKQRVGIARAIAVNPTFIVADEPVAALDVSIKSGILNLMKDLQKEMNLTYLFISHDLSTVRYICDRVAVMYLGKIIEIAETDELFNNPLHPYTEALISAIPIPDPTIKRDRIILPGSVPTPINPPPGCRFNPRCIKAVEECQRESQELVEIKPGHYVACRLYKQ